MRLKTAADMTESANAYRKQRMAVDRAHAANERQIAEHRQALERQLEKIMRSEDAIRQHADIAVRSFMPEDTKREIKQETDDATRHARAAASFQMGVPEKKANAALYLATRPSVIAFRDAFDFLNQP